MVWGPLFGSSTPNLQTSRRYWVGRKCRRSCRRKWLRRPPWAKRTQRSNSHLWKLRTCLLIPKGHRIKNLTTKVSHRRRLSESLCRDNPKSLLTQDRNRAEDRGSPRRLLLSIRPGPPRATLMCALLRGEPKLLRAPASTIRYLRTWFRNAPPESNQQTIHANNRLLIRANWALAAEESFPNSTRKYRQSPKRSWRRKNSRRRSPLSIRMILTMNLMKGLVTVWWT